MLLISGSIESFFSRINSGGTTPNAQNFSQTKADEIDRIIDTFPVDIIDVDKDLARVAGKYKASKKMSYADCMAAALAKIHRAELITGDREFKEVEKEIKICWI